MFLVILAAPRRARWRSRRVCHSEQRRGRKEPALSHGAQRQIFSRKTDQLPQLSYLTRPHSRGGWEGRETRAKRSVRRDHLTDVPATRRGALRRAIPNRSDRERASFIFSFFVRSPSTVPIHATTRTLPRVFDRRRRVREWRPRKTRENQKRAVQRDERHPRTIK